MIRVVVFLVVAALLALGVVWLADRPGQIADHLARLSHRHLGDGRLIAIVAIALRGDPAVVAARASCCARRSCFRSPLRERQRAQGLRGDLARADRDRRGRCARRATPRRRMPREPAGRAARAAAARADRAARRRPRRRRATRSAPWRSATIPGCSACAGCSSRRSAATIRSRRGSFAEEAAKDAPALAWAGQAVLEFRCAAGDWEGALAILERHAQARHDRPRRIPAPARRAAHRARARRRGGRTATRRARSRSRRQSSRPTWCRRRRSRAGCSPRPASGARPARILEAAWKQQSASRSRRRLCASAARRIRRATGWRACRRWPRMAPGHAEGALAVARAALDAREFATARDALAPLLAAPTQRVAMLMAELEELEGDEGRAREWMARALNAARDPAWTADGFVSDRWLPVSPVTGRLDAFEWKVPVAELDAREPVDDRGAGRARVRRAVRPGAAGQELPREVPSPPLGNVTPETTAPRCRARLSRAPRRSFRSPQSPTTRAPSRRRIPMRNWPSRSPTPGNGFVSFSGETLAVRKRTGRLHAFPRVLFRACGRPTSPCGLPRGRLSGAPEVPVVACSPH